MIELKKSSVELSQAHKIMSFTETVLEDEFPLIRFAITELGFTIIVVTVDTDEDTNVFRYLHVPVSQKKEHEYRESEITLRDIVLSAPWLNLVETDENDEPVKVYQFSPAEFPKEYLPLEGSFIPKSYLKTLESKPEHSFDLIVKLDGLSANRHMVESKNLNKINESVSKHLLSTLTLINQNDSIFLYQKVPKAASYDLVFSFIQEREIDAFLSFENTRRIVEKILEYITVSFPDEFELLKIVNQPASKFNTLVNTLFPMVEDFFTNKREFATALQKGVFQSGGLFANLPYEESFKSISFYSNERIIGCLDGEKKYKYMQAETYFKKVLGVELLNDIGTEYEISIYTLSTKTKKGKALLSNGDSHESKPRAVEFTIEGLNKITHSKYTQALDSGESIKVRGDLTTDYKGTTTLTIIHR